MRTAELTIGAGRQIDRRGNHLVGGIDLRAVEARHVDEHRFERQLEFNFGERRRLVAAVADVHEEGDDVTFLRNRGLELRWSIARNQASLASRALSVFDAANRGSYPGPVQPAIAYTGE